MLRAAPEAGGGQDHPGHRIVGARIETTRHHHELGSELAKAGLDGYFPAGGRMMVTLRVWNVPGWPPACVTDMLAWR